MSMGKDIRDHVFCPGTMHRHNGWLKLVRYRVPGCRPPTYHAFQENHSWVDNAFGKDERRQSSCCLLTLSHCVTRSCFLPIITYSALSKEAYWLWKIGSDLEGLTKMAFLLDDQEQNSPYEHPECPPCLRVRLSPWPDISEYAKGSWEIAARLSAARLFVQRLER